MGADADVITDEICRLRGQIDAAVASVIEIARAAEDLVPGAVMQADAAVEGHEGLHPDLVAGAGKIAVGILALDCVYAVRGCPAVVGCTGNDGRGDDQVVVAIAICHLVRQIQLDVAAAVVLDAAACLRGIELCHAAAAGAAGEAVDDVVIERVAVDGLTAAIAVEADVAAVGRLELHR